MCFKFTSTCYHAVLRRIRTNTSNSSLSEVIDIDIDNYPSNEPQAKTSCCRSLYTRIWRFVASYRRQNAKTFEEESPRSLAEAQKEADQLKALKKSASEERALKIFESTKKEFNELKALAEKSPLDKCTEDLEAYIKVLVDNFELSLSEEESPKELKSSEPELNLSEEKSSKEMKASDPEHNVSEELKATEDKAIEDLEAFIAEPAYEMEINHTSEISSSPQTLIQMERIKVAEQQQMKLPTLADFLRALDKSYMTPQLQKTLDELNKAEENIKAAKDAERTAAHDMDDMDGTGEDYYEEYYEEQMKALDESIADQKVPDDMSDNVEGNVAGNLIDFDDVADFNGAQNMSIIGSLESDSNSPE